jgi:hypothetical protein
MARNNRPWRSPACAVGGLSRAPVDLSRPSGVDGRNLTSQEVLANRGLPLQGVSGQKMEPRITRNQDSGELSWQAGIGWRPGSSCRAEQPVQRSRFASLRLVRVWPRRGREWARGIPKPTPHPLVFPCRCGIKVWSASHRLRLRHDLRTHSPQSSLLRRP